MEKKKTVLGSAVLVMIVVLGSKFLNQHGYSTVFVEDTYEYNGTKYDFNCINVLYNEQYIAAEYKAYN